MPSANGKGSAEPDSVDPVKSFMTTNPQDNFPKDTEDEKIGTLSFTPETVETPEGAPVAETPELDSQGEPVAPAAPASEEPAVAAPAEGSTPEAKPVAATPEAKPAIEAAAPAPSAPVEPPKPSYAMDEKIHLVEGSEPWTREQVVAALHERATLQPRAQEADQFKTLFGFDYAKAEQQWKPILDILRSDPERTNFVDMAMHADPELLAYLRDSAEFYKQQKGVTPAAAAAAAATATPSGLAATAGAAATDPRIDAALKYIEQQKQQAGIDRANREWNTVFEKYPFFRTDAKALEGLKATANVLIELDRKAGKDDLECRGLLDALAINAAIYDAMLIGRNAAAAPAPIVAPAPAPVDPLRGREALLGSNGPAPSGASRPARPKDYTGNPDGAVAAFLAEHPES